MRIPSAMTNGRRLVPAPYPQKLRCLQIQRTTDTPHAGSIPTGAEFYDDWPWDTIIKPQMDLAIAIGANTLKFFTAVDGIRLGLYDRAEHEAKLRQALEYMASCRVAAYMAAYFYPSEGMPYPVTDAAAEAELLHAVGVMGEYAHVVGVDMNNEADVSWSASYADWCRPRVRAVAPRLPFSVSLGSIALTGQVDEDWAAYLGAVDFVDVHPYNWSGDVGDLDDFLALVQSKPWLAGEGPINAATSDLSVLPGCLGAVGYTTYDCLPAPFAYAIATPADGIIRPELVADFQTWPAWPPREPTV